jgi:hypothetical protein
MKRTYTSPLVTITDLALDSLLTVSGFPQIDDDTEVTTDQALARTMHRSVWDDDDDE